jgi:hypothetical protein
VAIAETTTSAHLYGFHDRLILIAQVRTCDNITASAAHDTTSGDLTAWTCNDCERLMKLGGISKVGHWWRSLGTTNQIAVIGLVIALVGILPGYLALRSSRDPRSSQPAGSPTVAGATSTSSPPSEARSELKLDATYAWTAQGIMWALPRQLTPQDEPIVQMPGLVGNLAAQQKIEALLAKRNGVKIAGDSRGEERPFSELRLVVTGQHSRPVLITGIKANILKREPPLSETIVYGPPEGVGENIQIGFDLDSLSPVAQRFDNEMFLAGPYFATHHVSVKDGEQAVFSIRAFTSKCYCEWEIIVEANIEGKHKGFIVRNGSRPFRTTAFADSYRTAYKFDFFKGQFVRLPPGSKVFD